MSEKEKNEIDLNRAVEIEKVAADSELQFYAVRICAHSGKPCGKISNPEIADLVRIHGRRVAIEILKAHQRTVSLEWTWLNTEGLDNLAALDLEGYFVYTCGKLLRDISVLPELMRLHDARKAREQLAAFDDDLIATVCELQRRILKSIPPEKLPAELRGCLPAQIISKITKSLDSLIAHKTCLERVLAKLYENKQKQKRYESKAYQTAIRNQKMIRALSSLEREIYNELNDLELIPGKSRGYVETMTSGRRKDGVKKSKTRYSSKPFEVKPKTGGIKLRIAAGGKTSSGGSGDSGSNSDSYGSGTSEGAK